MPPRAKPPTSENAPTTQDAPGVPWALVWPHAVDRVLVAGMLDDDPSLRTAELSEQEWRAKLDAYAESPRP